MSQRYAAGRIDDEVGGETPRRSANVLEPHACDAALVGRSDHLGDARAGPDFDVRLLFDPMAADALERRARESELVVSKVALGKGRFQVALTWPETQRRVKALLERGLQQDGDFEKGWPAVLGNLLDESQQS